MSIIMCRLYLAFPSVSQCQGIIAPCYMHILNDGPLENDDLTRPDSYGSRDHPDVKILAFLQDPGLSAGLQQQVSRTSPLILSLQIKLQ